MEAEAASFFKGQQRSSSTTFISEFMIAMYKNRDTPDTSRSAANKQKYVHAMLVELAHKILQRLPGTTSSNTLEERNVWKAHIGENQKGCKDNIHKFRQTLVQIIAPGAPSLSTPSKVAFVPRTEALLRATMAFLGGSRASGMTSILNADEAIKTLQPFLLYHVIGADPSLIRMNPFVPQDVDALDVQAQVWRRNLLWREAHERDSNYEVFEMNARAAQVEAISTQLVNTSYFHPPAVIVIGSEMANLSTPVPLILIAQDKECHLLVCGQGIGMEPHAVATDFNIEHAMTWRTKLNTERLVAVVNTTNDNLSFPIVQVRSLGSPDLSREVSQGMRFAVKWTPLVVAIRLLTTTNLARERKALDIDRYVENEQFFKKMSAAEWETAIEKALAAMLTTLLNQLAAQLYKDWISS